MHNTGRALAGGTFLRQQQKSSSSPRAVSVSGHSIIQQGGVGVIVYSCVFTWRSHLTIWNQLVYTAPPGLISLPNCLTVHLSVRNTKKCNHLTYELKVGYPCGVICPLSIPSKYLSLCARRKFGFIKEVCRKLLIIFVNYQPNLCTAPAERGLEEPF